MTDDLIDTIAAYDADQRAALVAEIEARQKHERGSPLVALLEARLDIQVLLYLYTHEHNERKHAGKGVVLLDNDRKALQKENTELATQYAAVCGERDMLQTHLDDARKSRDFFHQQQQAACKQVEELAPLARESGGLKADLIIKTQRLMALEACHAALQEEYAALIGVCRDNDWQGVAEGQHAYLWQAFLDTQVGAAEQRHQAFVAAQRGGEEAENG